MKHFQSVLVANRGEIAVRIMRTAALLGLRTIAVYSDADCNAPHVALADDAVLLGPAPAAQSYLNIERVIAAAAQAGAEAIHPGYGFLSENAEFATAVHNAGLTFIGPTPDAIRLMGDKAASKRRMIAAGVPCIPGYEEDDQSDDRLIAAAGDIGFPVMVKASAGGGGRGMRRVEQASELNGALAGARAEALSAFGSDVLLIEKALDGARHVEVQVFADTHGNVIHLGERDCSVQRRHQKVIEEAPCPVMTPALRERMGAAATEAARSIDYRGAGTVEFLLDAEQNFYFLEMNTRLQVEHPVTEMICGHDLVEWQLRIADGEALPMQQHELELDGHAIEARLYAEDVAAGFLPATGILHHWEPCEDDGIRVDSGVMAGQEVSPFYDPMLAKFIAWGRTRDEARLGLAHALRTSEMFGVTTNRGFLLDVLNDPTFVAGDATTAMLAGAPTDNRFGNPPIENAQVAFAACLLFVHRRNTAFAASLPLPEVLLNWSSGDPVWAHYDMQSGDSRFQARLRPINASEYAVQVGDDTELISLTDVSVSAAHARIRAHGRRHDIGYALLPDGQLQLVENGHTTSFTDLSQQRRQDNESSGGGQARAPMHGIVVQVLVGLGDTVAAGATLAVMEAMKMQHDLHAGVSGTIAAIHVTQGDQIAEGALVIEIEADDSATETEN